MVGLDPYFVMLLDHSWDSKLAVACFASLLEAAPH